MILATETSLDAGGRTLACRPLSIAFGRLCTFRPLVVAALNAAGIAWQMVVETDNDSVIHATVSTDLAVHIAIEGTQARQLVRIDHAGAFPALPDHLIDLYASEGSLSEPLAQLVTFVSLALGQK